MAPQNYSKCVKKVSFQYKHGLMLFVNKIIKKPPGTSIKMCQNRPHSRRFFMAENA